MADKNLKYDRTIFYASFYKTINKMPDTERLNFYDKVMEYGFYGETEDFQDFFKQAFFDQIKCNIDSYRRKAKLKPKTQKTTEQKEDKEKVTIAV